MKKMLILVYIFLMILSSCNKIHKNEYISVQLTKEDLQKYKLDVPSVFLRPSNDRSPFYEEVIDYPVDYKNITIFNHCLNTNQFLYNLFLTDSTQKKDYFNRNPEDNFKNWKQNYTKDSIDYISSMCFIEDSSGNYYLIFDKNNDEDLTNDKPMNFISDSIEFNNEKYHKNFVFGYTQTQYFDGERILSKNVKLRITKEPNYYLISSVEGCFGNFKIDNLDYKIGIFNYGEIEYSKYNDIWIDVNQNSIFDYNIDLLEQMYIPFTLNGNSYRIMNINRFGDYIDIVKCNQDSIPPIAIGKPAPDFTEITIEEKTISLSDYLGNYIILDFWSCRSDDMISIMTEVENELKEEQNIKIITFGIYPDDHSKFTWEKIIDNLDLDTRLLYQVGGAHTTFIIDKNGNIINKLVNPDSNIIIDSINKLL